MYKLKNLLPITTLVILYGCLGAPNFNIIRQKIEYSDQLSKKAVINAITYTFSKQGMAVYKVSEDVYETTELDISNIMEDFGKDADKQTASLNKSEKYKAKIEKTRKIKMTIYLDDNGYKVNTIVIKEYLLLKDKKLKKSVDIDNLSSLSDDKISKMSGELAVEAANINSKEYMFVSELLDSANSLLGIKSDFENIKLESLEDNKAKVALYPRY